MPIKTYVLLGYNQEEKARIYESWPDTVILRPEEGESVEDVAKKITPPANVIVQCHGVEDGYFQWQKGKKGIFDYAELFDSLPRSGIIAIGIGSCNGGAAQQDEDILETAPPGCFIFSMTSAETTSASATGAQFAIEARRLQNPVNLYLEVLDNFSPIGYQQVGKYPNQKSIPYNITDPEKALPRILGLGGEPSKQIDLAVEIKRLRNAEPEAMKRAIEQVQARFDTKQCVTVVSDKDKKGAGTHVSQFLGAGEEHKLDERIATMAAKLQQGYSPKGADEKRIAYALTAAYLDQSGQLQRWINAQPGYVTYEKRLDQLGIHNTAELVGYIKERGDARGLVGTRLTNGTIEQDELKKIIEAGQLLGKTVTYTQNAGSNDCITLEDGHGITNIKVKLDPSIQRGH